MHFPSGRVDQLCVLLCDQVTLFVSGQGVCCDYVSFLIFLYLSKLIVPLSLSFFFVFAKLFFFFFNVPMVSIFLTLRPICLIIVFPELSNILDNVSLFSPWQSPSGGSSLILPESRPVVFGHVPLVLELSLLPCFLPVLPPSSLLYSLLVLEHSLQ